jgi:hypothetical protein
MSQRPRMTPVHSRVRLRGVVRRPGDRVRRPREWAGEPAPDGQHEDQAE